MIFPTKDIGPDVSEKPFEMIIPDFWFPKKVLGSEASEKLFGSSEGVRKGIWGHPLQQCFPTTADISKISENGLVDFLPCMSVQMLTQTMTHEQVKHYITDPCANRKM